MEYPKREKGKTLIGSWASGFAAKSSFEINQAMSKCDLVYALKEGESLRSLEARIKPSKCRAFPPYVNNTEAAHEWLNHKHGPNKYTFVPPEVMFRYTGLVEEVLQKWEIHYEALKKRLPTSAANALDVLDKEVRKMDEERGRIVDEYNQACRSHNQRSSYWMPKAMTFGSRLGPNATITYSHSFILMAEAVPLPFAIQLGRGKISLKAF